MYKYPDYIAHYGIKGMKWGIRKKAVSSGKKIKSKASSLNKKRISSYSKDYQETKTLRRKSSKKLSNDQLKTLNKRMELEQNYNRLSTSSINRGVNVARQLVGIAGTIGGLYAVSQSPWVEVGMEILKKKLKRK